MVLKGKSVLALWRMAKSYRTGVCVGDSSMKVGPFSYCGAAASVSAAV